MWITLSNNFQKGVAYISKQNLFCLDAKMDGWHGTIVKVVLYVYYLWFRPSEWVKWGYRFVLPSQIGLPSINTEIAQINSEQCYLYIRLCYQHHIHLVWSFFFSMSIYSVATRPYLLQCKYFNRNWLVCFFIGPNSLIPI